jgi:hypothetical protein
VVFAPLADARQLDAWVTATGKLDRQQRGEVVVYHRAREPRAIVVRSGVVHFVQSANPGDDTAWTAAERLAQRQARASLAASEPFRRAVAGVRFGADVGVYLRPEAWIADAGADAEGREAAFHRRVALLGILKEGGPVVLEEERRVARKERGDAVAALGRQLAAVAVGVDVRGDTLRAKAFVATSRAGPLRLEARPARVLEEIAKLEARPRHAFAAQLAPPALRALAIARLGEWRILAVEKQLALGGVDAQSELWPLFSGEVALAEVEQGTERRAAVLVADLADAAGARSRALEWMSSEAARALLDDRSVRSHPEGVIEVTLGGGKSLWLRLDRRTLWLSSERWALSTRAPRAEAPRLSWLAASTEPLVAALAGIDDPFALIVIEPRDWRTWRGLVPAMTPVRRSRFPFRSFTPSPRQQKLQRELATLVRRQLVARDAAGEQLLTALGTTFAVVRPAAGGYLVYGAQALGEDDLESFGEQLVSAFVEGGPASEGGAQVAELRGELGKIDRDLPTLIADLARLEVARAGMLR